MLSGSFYDQAFSFSDKFNTLRKEYSQMIINGVREHNSHITSVEVETQFTPFGWVIEDARLYIGKVKYINEELSSDILDFVEINLDIICSLFGMNMGHHTLKFVA